MDTFSADDMDTMESMWERHEKAGLCMHGSYNPRKMICALKAEYMLMSVNDPTSWSNDHRGMPICDMHMQMVENIMIDEDPVYFLDMEWIRQLDEHHQGQDGPGRD